jgi:hypothetical protein
MKHLFLLGPADGQWLEAEASCLSVVIEEAIPLAHIVRFDASDEPEQVIKRTIYIPLPLEVEEGEQILIFVPLRTTLSEAVKTLINNYPMRG